MKTYRQLKEELDALIIAMEDPDTAIEKLNENFEKASQLISQMEKILTDKKKQLGLTIRKIK